jgi:hypothetical protein
MKEESDLLVFRICSLKFNLCRYSEGRGRDEAQLVLSAEQALPIRPDMLSFNR